MTVPSPQKLVSFVARMPSTNARILATILMAGATTLVYLTGAILYGAGVLHVLWVPSPAWLAFLLAMAGIDTAHFAAKRSTDSEYVAARAAAPGGGA